MAFLCDNAGTLNCYKLMTFVLLKMSGCLRKQVVEQLQNTGPLWSTHIRTTHNTIERHI